MVFLCNPFTTHRATHRASRCVTYCLTHHTSNCQPIVHPITQPPFSPSRNPSHNHCTTHPQPIAQHIAQHITQATAHPKGVRGEGYKSCVFSHQIYGALWWTRNHQFQLNQPTNQPNNTQTNEERKGREKKDVHSANNFMFINYHLNSHLLFYSSVYNCSMCTIVRS